MLALGLVGWYGPRMPRPKPELVLTDDERAQLESAYKPHEPVGF